MSKRCYSRGELPSGVYADDVGGSVAPSPPPPSPKVPASPQINLTTQWEINLRHVWMHVARASVKITKRNPVFQPLAALLRTTTPWLLWLLSFLSQSMYPPNTTAYRDERCTLSSKRVTASNAILVCHHQPPPIKGKEHWVTQNGSGAMIQRWS